MKMSLWESVHDAFKVGNITGAVSLLEGYVSNHDSDKFGCLVGCRFANSPGTVLGELNRFIESNARKFDVRGVYLEMNGFDINYDRWYFDLFAYSDYTSQFDDIDWLSDWQSGEWPKVDLAGMSEVQDAFSWYHERRIWKSRPELEPVYQAAMLLVMAKFAAFVGSVLEAGALIRAVPVLATAHGFQSVARYEP